MRVAKKVDCFVDHHCRYIKLRVQMLIFFDNENIQTLDHKQKKTDEVNM